MLNRLVLGFLLISSILSLVVNRGFYFYENHSNVQLTLSGDEAAVNQAIEQISSDNNIANIDRTNKKVTFEGIDRENVESLINENFGESDVETSITQNFYSSSSDLRKTFISIAILVASSLAIFLYFILKIKQKFNKRQVGIIIFSYILCTLLTNIIILGFLSIVSRFYMLRNIDLLALLVANLWISILFFFAIWEMKYEKFTNISSFYSTIDLRKPIYIKLALTVLLVNAVGLGVNFVVPTLLIAFSFFISNFVLNNIGNILTSNINLKPPKLKFVPLFRIRRPRKRVDAKVIELIPSKPDTKRKKKKRK